MTKEQSDLMRKILHAKSGDDIQFLDEGWCLRWLARNSYFPGMTFNTDRKCWEVGCYYTVGKAKKGGAISIDANFDDFPTALLRLVLTVMKEGK